MGSAIVVCGVMECARLVEISEMIALRVQAIPPGEKASVSGLLSDALVRASYLLLFIILSILYQGSPVDIAERGRGNL